MELKGLPWTWDKNSETWLYGDPENGCGVGVARTDHLGAVWRIIVLRDGKIETNKEAEDRSLEDAKAEALAYLFLGPDLKGGEPTEADIEWGSKIIEDLDRPRKL